MNIKRFTLVELLAVTAIIAILMAILLSTVSEFQAAAYRVNCGGAMGQNYSMFMLYTADYSQKCPVEYTLNSGGQKVIRTSDGTQRLLYNLYLNPTFELPSKQTQWNGIFRCGAFAFNGSAHGNITDAGIGFNQTSSGYSEMLVSAIQNPANKVVMMDWPASYISGGNNVFNVPVIAGNSNTAHVPGAGTVTFLDTTAFMVRGELNYSWPGPFKDFVRGRHGAGSLNANFFDGSVQTLNSSRPAKDFYLPETAGGRRATLYWDRLGYGLNNVAVTVNNMFNPREK